jgi:hypothetical protein
VLVLLVVIALDGKINMSLAEAFAGIAVKNLSISPQKLVASRQPSSFS